MSRLSSQVRKLRKKSRKVPNSFLEDVSITFTDETDGSGRTKRYIFWMYKRKTLAPYLLGKIMIFFRQNFTLV